MAVSRLARLTLFSGPQCSLCEIAKAELAKVKKLRPARIRPGGNQHPGQGPGTVEEEIRLLDTSAASRREGDSQGSLGCLHSASGAEATGSDSTVPKIDGITGPPLDCFVVDTTSSIYPSSQFLGQWQCCLYDRIPGITLGEVEDESPAFTKQDLRLCFNCGSPDHAVVSCPEPINQQLVSLSRQLFNFHHPNHNGQEAPRFYVAEGRRQQRLEWLRSYDPGVIRGPLLRDALGLQQGDPGNTVEWLHNMAYWGYPPGWFGRRNPRQLVCSRILDDVHVASPELESLMIIEGTDDDEEIDLTLFSLGGPSTASFHDAEPTRWATYPNTYFSSTALSVYNGTPLDRLPSSPSGMSITFTPERKALWERILSGSMDPNGTPSAPPWRLPGAVGASAMEGAVKDFVPPPPSTTPPPLPLTSNSPLSTPASQECSVRVPTPGHRSERATDDDRSVVDMDMSDD